MDNYLFLKLSQKVKECNSKQITDSDFEYDDLTEGFTSAWFEIHKLPYRFHYSGAAPHVFRIRLRSHYP